MSRAGTSQATISQLLLAMNDWRDRMVSFDGRNRQLFYRNLKTGDVDLSDKSIDLVTLNSLIAGKPVFTSTLYPELFKESKREKTPGDSSLDDELTDLVAIEGPKVPKEWNTKLFIVKLKRISMKRILKLASLPMVSSPGSSQVPDLYRMHL